MGKALPQREAPACARALGSRGSHARPRRGHRLRRAAPLCDHHGPAPARPDPDLAAGRFRARRHPRHHQGRRAAHAAADARIHDLRHTTGMRTLRKTGNLRVVQKILGHTDIAITAKFYTDATVEDMRAAMEATAPREIASADPKLIDQKKE